jgi:hypothetical protein
MRHLVLAFLAAACTGCIVYPKEVSVYDRDCGVRSKKLTLEAGLVLSDCHANTADQAEVCLLVIAGSAVVSTVISGSIVVVGNTIYWLEKQGRCQA